MVTKKMMVMKKMKKMTKKMMACSIRASHANHVNPNQCSSSGTHKSFGNREICNQRKREICILKRRNMHWKSQKCNDGRPVFFRKVHLTTRSNFVKLQSYEILRRIVTALLLSSDKIWRHNVIVTTYHRNYHLVAMAIIRQWESDRGGKDRRIIQSLLWLFPPL